MLIHKGKRAVVLRLRDHSRVTAVIPTARCGQNNLVAVPHRPDETRVLRNLGFTVPDPMPLHYEWPKVRGQHVPFIAQRETASFLSMNRRAFCLNGMGTGKTNSALWAYDYLRGLRSVRRALVICPLSTMERTWSDSVFETFPHLSCNVLYGTRERRLKLLSQEADIYVINIDAISVIKDELAKREDIDLVIVDELAMCRNQGTTRFKAIDQVINRQLGGRRWVWGMTGSPTPNLPTDAWAQARLIVPTNPDVPKYFGRFRDHVMRQQGPFKWTIRDNAMDQVYKIMQPAIRYSLDECVDLPEQIFITRDVPMTPEQKKAYGEMLTRMTTEAAEGKILAVNEAIKANKLIQIACGVAYDTQGNTVELPSKPRVDALCEIIEESEGKVIVFVPLTGALNAVKAMLVGEGYTVEVVNGETSKSERDAIFFSFQNTPEPRVLLANPYTMSHGLTLTAATTICWYAPIHSNETYSQANARVRRPGQKKKTVIAHIAGSDIERRVYKRLASKESMQGILLDMVQESRGKEQF